MKGKVNKMTNLSIMLAKNNYLVQSGKSTFIQAVVEDWTKPNEKELLWSAEKGSIDKNGKYVAPTVTQDDVDEVTVSCVKDRTVVEKIGIQIDHTDSTDEFVKIGEIKAIGENGRYSLNIQCLNIKNIGHKCSIVITDYNQDLPRILPPANYQPGQAAPAGKLPIREWSKFQIAVKISKMGYASVHLKPFKQKIRKLHVRVKGSSIDREVILKGPKPKVVLKKGAGFWNNATQNFSKRRKKP